MTAARGAAWAGLLAVVLVLIVSIAELAPGPRPIVRLPVLAIDQGEDADPIELDAEDLVALARRPRTRAECIDGPRPCPWAGCKYSLLLDMARRTGSLRINPSTTGETCALDVAKRGAHSQEEVMALLGWRMIDSVRQTERSAEAQMRVHGGEGLREVLLGFTEAAHPPGEPCNGSLSDVAFGAETPVHLRTPEIAAREAERLDAFATQAAALVRGGLPVAVAWRVATHLLEGDTSPDDDAEQDDEDAAAPAALEEVHAAAPAEEDGDDPMPIKEKNVIPESPAKPSRRPPGELRALVLDELQRGGSGNVRDLAARIDAQVGNVRRVLKLAAAEGLAHHDGRGSRACWTHGPSPATSEPAPVPMPRATPTRSAPRAVDSALVLELLRAGDRELVLALLQADEKRLELVARLLDRLGDR